MPSFGTFGYYFMLDVVKISKFTIAMLSVIGYICLMIGSSIYHKCFSKREFRQLMVYNTIIGLLFAPLNMLFVLRKNEQYGLPDMFVILFTDVVFDTLSQCMVFLPLMVLFAKITPKRIEATCFAFLTGTCNMTSSLRGLVGSYVNRRYVGVT